MKPPTLTLALSVALLLGTLFPQRASAQLPTFDASNFAQAVLNYIRDGQTASENVTLFLENIGISQEMLSNLQKWNNLYHEISSYVSKGVTAIEITTTYGRLYQDFIYFMSSMKDLENDGISYDEIRSYISGAWYYLLLASREIKSCREYLKSDIKMTDGERLVMLKASEKSLKRTLAALTLYMADKLRIIDGGRSIGKDCEILYSSFRMSYN